MEFSKQEYWSGLPFPYSRGSSGPRDQTQVSLIVGRFFTDWATREALTKPHTLSEFPVSLCYCSVPQACPTLQPWTAASQASLSFAISRRLLRLLSIESMMPFNPSSLVVPFSSCHQSFLHQGPFQSPYWSPFLLEDPIEDTTIRLVRYSFNIHN